MFTEAEGDALIARLNTSTNKLAQIIRDLRAQHQAGGMSEAQEDAFEAKLEAVAVALEGFGADPADPVPDVEP